MKLFKNFYTLTICLLCCFTLLLVPNPNKTNLDVKADTLTPNSKASVLMEYDTKQVLYEHNSFPYELQTGICGKKNRVCNQRTNS